MANSTFVNPLTSQFLFASCSIWGDTSRPVTVSEMAASGMIKRPTPQPNSSDLPGLKVGSSREWIVLSASSRSLSPERKNSDNAASLRFSRRNLSSVITAKYGLSLPNSSQSLSEPFLMSPVRYAHLHLITEKYTRQGPTSSRY